MYKCSNEDDFTQIQDRQDTGTAQEQGHGSHQGSLTLVPQDRFASLWEQLPPLSVLTKHNYDFHMSQKLRL